MLNTKALKQLNKVVDDAQIFSETLDSSKTELKDVPLNTQKDYIKNANIILEQILNQLEIPKNEINLKDTIKNAENNISKVVNSKKYGVIFFNLYLVKQEAKTFALKFVGRGVRKEIDIYHILNLLDEKYNFIVPKKIASNKTEGWLVLEKLDIALDFSFKDKFIYNKLLTENILNKFIDAALEISVIDEDALFEHDVYLKKFDKETIEQWFTKGIDNYKIFFPKNVTKLTDKIINLRNNKTTKYLSHGDFSLQNLSVQNKSNKVVILDWEKAQINHKYHDIAQLYVQTFHHKELYEYWDTKLKKIIGHDVSARNALLSSILLRTIIEITHIVDGYGPCRLYPLIQNKSDLKEVCEKYLINLFDLQQKALNDKLI